MPAELVIDGLQKSFGHPVLRGASAQFPAGQVTALLGDNGSGKTTLFCCLLGLYSSGGTVRITAPGDAAAGTRRPPHHGEIFGVFEESTLYPRWTVTQNIRYQLRHGGSALPDVVLELVPERILRARAGRLSAGQTRLVLLAIALASDASVLLLDEFSNGLDHATRAAVRQALLETARTGRVVIVSSHDFMVFEGLADQFWQLADGLLHDRTELVKGAKTHADAYASLLE